MLLRISVLVGRASGDIAICKDSTSGGFGLITLVTSEGLNESCKLSELTVSASIPDANDMISGWNTHNKIFESY